MPNGCAGSVAAQQYTDQAECGSEVFDMWGSSVPCSIATSEFDLGSIAACPNNVCSGWGSDPYSGKPSWLTFTADSAASEYLSRFDWNAGVNDWGGEFVNNVDYSADISAQDILDEFLQFARFNSNLKKDFPGARAGFTALEVTGGHANFPVANCDACLGRWAGGLHIEEGANGLQGHDDTLSPYIGSRFSWGALNPVGVLVHAVFDVGYGHIVYLLP